MNYKAYIDFRQKILYDQISETYGINPGSLAFEETVKGWALRGGTGVPVQFQDITNIDQIGTSEYSIIYAFKFKLDALAVGNTFMFDVGSTSGSGSIGLYTNSSGHINAIEKNNSGFTNFTFDSTVYVDDSWIIVHIRRNSAGFELLINGVSIDIISIFTNINHNNDAYLFFHGDNSTARKEKSASLYWGFFKEYISDEVIEEQVEIFQTLTSGILDQCYYENATKNCGFKEWKFSLTNPTFGQLNLEYAPDGWTGGGATYERNKTYKSVLRSFSTNELQLPKDGRDFIKKCYEAGGINTIITIAITRYNHATFLHEPFYVGKLDCTTYLIDEIFVSIQMIDNSFTEKFKSREDIELDLYNLTTIGGMTLSPFPNVEELTIELPEYKRGYLAKWSVDTHRDYASLNIFDVGLDIVIAPPPLKSFGFAQDGKWDHPALYTKDISFLLDVPPYFNEFYLHIGLPNLNLNQKTPVIPWVATLILREFFGDGLTDFSDTGLAVGGSSTIGMDLPYNDTVLISLNNKTKSWALVIEASQTISAVNSGVQAASVTLIPKYPLKNVVALPIYETFYRLTQLTTDKPTPLISDFFGQTDSDPTPYASNGELLAIVNGRQIRGGVDVKTVISLKKTFKSVNAVFPIGLGIEGEKVRIENEDYFFDENVIIDYSDIVNELKISKEVLPDWHYNSIKVGTSKSDGTVYNLITEINSVYTYGTDINVLKSELNLVSDFRLDTFGITDIRKPTEKEVDKEKEYDTWLIDLYRRGNLDFKAREQEGFVTIASNNTITTGSYNLRITPFRNIRRHYNSIKASLHKLLGTKIIYLSSKTIANLYSKFTGESITVWSDDNIDVNSLPDSRWIPEKLMVEVPFSNANQQALDSNVNGIIKLSDSEYVWVLRLQTDNKNKKAEIEGLRVNLDVVTPVEL